MSKVKIKVGPGGIMPTQTSRNVWALDLIASSSPVKLRLQDGRCNATYQTSVNIKIPKNTAMVITPRSFLNGLNATDSSFCRGNGPKDIEVIYEFDMDVDETKLPQKGDKVGTLLLIAIPNVGDELEFEED